MSPIVRCRHAGSSSSACTRSESHPTHLAIFGAAMRYLSTMGPQARLRLYHEVSVLPADEQAFTYVDCRPGTGLYRP